MNGLEKTLTPPTANEVIHALKSFLKDKTIKWHETKKEFYVEHVTYGYVITRINKINGGLAIIPALPLKVISKIIRFYEERMAIKNET